MNPILDPPRTVLLVGDQTAVPDGADEAIRDGEATDVRRVEGESEAARAIDEGVGLGCVVLACPLHDGSCADVCKQVRSRDEDLPVVVLAGADLEASPETLPVGTTAVLPADPPIDQLRAAVDDALDTYVRRRREAEHSDMLEALLDNLGEAIYFKDTEGRHVKMSEVPGGFHPGEARGKTDVELYGDENPEAAQEAYEDDMRVVREETPVFNRIERVGEDTDLWMRTTKVPWIDDDGEKRGLIGLTVNVTEYKQTERQLEELGHRFETFTSRLSHDVKTPLQIAGGNLEVALENGDRSAIKTARNAVRRAEQILEDYQTLSNQARETEEEKSPVDIAAMARDVWTTVQSDGADLQIDVQEGAVVNATEEMVRPVIENLLRNAVTHTDPGVTVRVGTTDDGFYVEDTGSGIPESEREKVVEEGYTTAEDGSGRGLSIVENQMDKHVWSLEVTESPEGGARFRIADCLADLPSVDTLEAAREVDIDGTTSVGDLTWGGQADYEEEFDRWRLHSDGVDIFRQDNEFFYAFATVSGPVTIQGRIVGVDYVDDYSKGGFMVRDALSTDASYAYVGTTPGHGSEILCRETPGEDGYSVGIDDNAFKFDWYRLDRAGDRVRTAISMDGHSWQPIETRTVALGDPIHVGLVACSCVPGRPCEVTFENVGAYEVDDAGAIDMAVDD